MAITGERGRVEPNSRLFSVPWSPAWLLLPVTLLAVLAAAGIYMHWRRQQDAESGTETGAVSIPLCTSANEEA